MNEFSYAQPILTLKGAGSPILTDISDLVPIVERYSIRLSVAAPAEGEFPGAADGHACRRISEQVATSAAFPISGDLGRRTCDSGCCCSC